VRKKEAVSYATMIKEINIQKNKKSSLGNLPKRYEDFDESLKNGDP